MTFRLIGALLVSVLFASLAHAEDSRWPDFGVSGETRGNAGTATYFQGFETPCFSAPYQPGAGSNDWVRLYSELVRVGTGSAGIASRNGFNHAEILPPLAGAPAQSSGAFTRLGGFHSIFGGGFVVELDVYFDLTDPRVLSGANAAYGWDASSAVNDQAGSFRRDFIFHTASNTSGQILVGASNVTNFTPRGDLATGLHYVVASSGWYTLQWVYRDAGDGSLAVDLNLRDQAGSVLFTRTLNNAADVIATQIGGNRYLWLTFVQSDRLAIDNARLNSGIRESLYQSTPAPGNFLNAGSANPGSPAPGTQLNVQSQGTLQLEVCSCTVSGPDAADYSVSACPTVLAPGQGATIGIACTPSGFGNRSAALTLSTNDSTGGSFFSYPLRCNGIDPGSIFADGFE
jgi:hypothetical protein